MNYIEDYEEYLAFLDKKFAQFFEKEKDYIFCKVGCSLCCEIGNYPFSQLEFEYLIHGSTTLPKETQEIIDEKIKQIKEAEKTSTESPFLYECPFLIDKKCCLYKYRGLICRSFGLIYYDENGELKIPSCVNEGLNYSNVYDPETKRIPKENIKEGQKEPVAYNIGLKELKENDWTKEHFDFGETKPLIDWFDE